MNGIELRELTVFNTKRATELWTLKRIRCKHLVRSRLMPGVSKRRLRRLKGKARLWRA